jgi:hypothetical protein
MPLAVASLLSACSTDDERSSVEEVGVPIAFAASLGADSTQATRAAGMITDVSNLYDQGFGVFACYTGLHKYADVNVRPNFMYNEKVVSNDAGTTWTYSPLKYWPNGEGEATGNTGRFPHYVSFFAYAPYSDTATDPEGYCISAFSHQGEQGDPWLTYRLHTDVAKQVDLLYAPALLDQTKPEVDYKLPFAFSHALACVGDKVSVDCSDAMKTQFGNRVAGGISNIRLDVTKLEIVYTLTSKARLVLWNGGEPKWEPIYSEDPVCTRTVTLVDAGNAPVVAYAYNETGISSKQSEWIDKGVFYIPIGMPGNPQTATVNVVYQVSTYNGSNWIPGATKEGSATLYLNEFLTAYKPGKHLYINITVNDDELSFTVTAAIAEWENGEVGNSGNVDAI